MKERKRKTHKEVQAQCAWLHLWFSSLHTHSLTLSFFTIAAVLFFSVCRICGSDNLRLDYVSEIRSSIRNLRPLIVQRILRAKEHKGVNALVMFLCDSERENVKVLHFLQE